jgi:hypothetical protein
MPLGERLIIEFETATGIYERVMHDPEHLSLDYDEVEKRYNKAKKALETYVKRLEKRNKK